MNRKRTWPSVLRQWRRALLGVCVAVISASALGVPITYIFTGTGTGTVGVAAFTNAAYTITLTGDTSAVTGAVLLFQNVTTATMTIASIGTATITEGVDIFDNQSGAGLGFQRDQNRGDLLDVTNLAFATYRLATSLGPISGLTPFALNQFTALASTLGAITISSSGPVTFSAAAAVTPVP